METQDPRDVTRDTARDLTGLAGGPAEDLERRLQERQEAAQAPAGIPAIEAPESPEMRSGTSTPPEGGGEAQEPAERPDSEVRRSWWRRMFGA
jgi:hypothetical protein